ncbi:hypothetical protein JCM19238_3729 [Vibrio ponticus]|nr:hypothetical protein JCM19238_3729 [Vibrio ponticus]
MEQLQQQLDQAGIKHREVTRYSTRVLLGTFTNNVTVIYDIEKGSYRIKTNWLLLTIVYSILVFNCVHSYLYSGLFLSAALAIMAMLGFVSVWLTEVRALPVKQVISQLNQSLISADN